MGSIFFDYFLMQFNFWLWALMGLIIFITLITNKGWKRFYFLIMIIGFLSLGKFIEHWYVSIALTFAWLLFMKLDFFVSKWVLFSVMIMLLFFDLSSPFFYLIVLALWIIMLWHFINTTFGALDSKPETS